MDHLTAVVLAGGQGTRLRPLTESLPKPILPVLNRPFLEYTLLNLAEAGVERVFLALGYKPDPIIEHFGIGSKVDLHIEYALETEPLGTSGAVRALISELDQTFLVINGDVTSEIDYRALLETHIENREYGTLAVHEVEDPSQFGLVLTDGEGYVTQFIEKPKGPRFRSKLINSGVYAVEPEVLRFVPEGFSMFETDLFPKVLSAGVQLNTHKWQGYFNDMGTVENYLVLQKDLMSGLAPHAKGASPYKGVEVKIDSSAILEGDIILGDGVRIESNAHLVGPITLGSGCHISQNVVIKSSILWENVKIMEHSKIENSVIGSNVMIKESSVIIDQVIGSNA